MTDVTNVELISTTFALSYFYYKNKKINKIKNYYYSLIASDAQWVMNRLRSVRTRVLVLPSNKYLYDDYSLYKYLLLLLLYIYIGILNIYVRLLTVWSSYYA